MFTLNKKAYSLEVPISPEEKHRQNVGLFRMALAGVLILLLLIFLGIKAGDPKPSTGSGDVTPYACDPYIPQDC